MRRLALMLMFFATTAFATVTAVTIPTPPNSNLARGMAVWIPSVGASSDPMKSDTNMQTLLNFCSSNGVNVLFLDMYGYLGGANWSTAHAQSFQKFIHFAHASGIKVYALAGNTDWGHNQQWVAANITKNIQQYQLYVASASTNLASGFDGVVLDAEYWTVSGYTSTEPAGMCDLMNAMRKALSLPIGFMPTQWLADPSSAALVFTYNGVNQIEGNHLMDNSDFVVVQSYSNAVTGTPNQIAMLNNWFTYASTTASKKNYGLYCMSLTDSGQPTGTSYWTGSSGAKAAMETNHTSISSNFIGSTNTNMSFLGQAIEQYSSYSQMN